MAQKLPAFSSAFSSIKRAQWVSRIQDLVPDEPESLPPTYGSINKILKPLGFLVSQETEERAEKSLQNCIAPARAANLLLIDILGEDFIRTDYILFQDSSKVKLVSAAIDKVMLVKTGQIVDSIKSLKRLHYRIRCKAKPVARKRGKRRSANKTKADADDDIYIIDSGNSTSSSEDPAQLQDALRIQCSPPPLIYFPQAQDKPLDLDSPSVSEPKSLPTADQYVLKWDPIEEFAFVEEPLTPFDVARESSECNDSPCHQYVPEWNQTEQSVAIEEPHTPDTVAHEISECKLTTREAYEVENLLESTPGKRKTTSDIKGAPAKKKRDVSDVKRQLLPLKECTNELLLPPVSNRVPDFDDTQEDPPLHMLDETEKKALGELFPELFV